MRLTRRAVCRGHKPTAEFLREQMVDRPPVTLWVGPRGGGKSFTSGLGAWLDSMAYDNHGTRILGGSLAQSAQIYQAMRHFDRARPGRSPADLRKTFATFCTGSEVEILAASTTSVRGPHVPRLRLDEVDEIDSDLRDDAMGMSMAMGGVRGSVVMTSTWHRAGGPMTELVERGRAGEFPVSTFCAWEILERCPSSRSGRHLERCPECPLMRWCHEDMGSHPSGVPKAKRARGHYAIDSLIQKVRVVSARILESDYFCFRPRAAGVWFTDFDEDYNVSPLAEYDPVLPVIVAVDSGVFTGAVLLQVIESPTGDHKVKVFAEYLAEGAQAERAALDILAMVVERCGIGARRRVFTDPAGGSRNAVGPTVLSEYMRVGLYGERGLECWPTYSGSVLDGLQLMEALVRSADGTVSLHIHPRCVRLVEAFNSYQRAKRGGQWQDYPADPQHPHEDLMDALRGGIKAIIPDSRRPPPKTARVNPRTVL